MTAAATRESFGANVRSLRKARKLSQSDVAAAMADAGYPLHQTQVAKIEGGTRPTPIEEAVALASILRSTIAALTGPLALQWHSGLVGEKGPELVIRQTDGKVLLRSLLKVMRDRPPLKWWQRKRCWNRLQHIGFALTFIAAGVIVGWSVSA